MRVRVLDDAASAAREGADLVAGWLAEPGRRTLMPAMGDTPQALYQELARRHANGTFDASSIVLAQMDEYLGLGPDDPRALIGWLRRSLAEPLEVPADRVVRLEGDDPDPAAACRRYDAALAAAGGVDVVVLGLGPNGHLGFNEPPSVASAPTRVVPLTEASLESNARYWGRRAAVPTRALTAGMGWMLQARRSLLVVTGAHKRAVLRELLTGPVGPALPGSYLRELPHAVLLVDRAAWPGDVPLPRGSEVVPATGAITGPGAGG